MALADPHPPGASLYQPADRERTTIVVADIVAREEPRHFELPGNYDPEAFSSDDRWLFVVEHLPALAPERYRVRLLDLESGQVGPLLTRTKEPLQAEEEMRGLGRMQVMAHTGTALYTLYTRQPDHLHTRELMAGLEHSAEPRAFVHVLSLAQGWAFCLDLPEPFGQGDPAGMAIALSPDSQRLYVVDRSSGLLAVADAGKLEVLEVVELGQPEQHVHGVTAAQVSRDGRLYVAAGSELMGLNAATLEREPGWMLDEPISGLRLSPDGERLYLGLAEWVGVFEAATGRQVGTLAAAGGERDRERGAAGEVERATQQTFEGGWIEVVRATQQTFEGGWIEVVRE